MVSVKMPQLGESITEGTIAKWLKQPGDQVKKYEGLVEIITDKVNAEVPAPLAGVLKEIKVKEGTTVTVGTEIAIKHLAPTLLGMSVEITVTVSEVEGRKVSFDVSAKDQIEPICSGTHGRFVVDVGKTIERLKAKAAKRAGGKAG